MHRSHENKGQHDAEKEKANPEVQYNEVHGSISHRPLQQLITHRSRRSP
jgi:hypothetical protein